MYRSNGLEAYHLINDEGGSFLYEGSVEYSEQELFKDEQGKTFFLVTTEIGGPAKYYVEVEPEGRPIPAAAAKKEKDISELVMASPREEAAAREPPPAPERPKPPEPPTGKQPDTCFEGPEKAPEKPPEKAAEPGAPVVPKPEAPVAPMPEAPQPSATEEAQAAVKAMASLGEHKPHKKRRLFSLPAILTVAIALVLVAAAVTAGIIIYKPGLVSGLNIPFLITPTPTPAPTVTPEPTTEPTTDVREHDLYNSLLAIGPAIDANNTSVAWFVANHTNEAGGSYHDLAKACDLFDHVNARWTPGQGGEKPQYAGDGVQTLKGDDRDYSVLMASLMQALGMESRVIAAYDGNAVRYYPEVKVASNESGYTDAYNYLRGRYNATEEPAVHVKGNVYWLGMAMGASPGIEVNATDEYCVDRNVNIEKL